MSLVEVRGLAKHYDTTSALRGVSFNINKGEWVSIIGPSGSGKSTLLNILGGLDRPSEGDVIIDGADIVKMNEQALAVFRRETIGFGYRISMRQKML